MNKFLTISAILFALVLYSFTEKRETKYIITSRVDTFPITNRSTSSLYVRDQRVYGGLNFNPPIYDDTTSANAGTNLGNDYDGAVIYSRKEHWFWGRFNHKWFPFANSSTSLFPTCGNPQGTHVVTWDSTLVFDISGGPYVLCCDGIPRFTRDTVLQLPPADPDNPRWYTFVLGKNGVQIKEGIAQPNPEIPQADSCEELLTFVEVNAGQTQPTFVADDNPYVIYDRNAVGEWPVDTVHFVTIDSVNTVTVAHQPFSLFTHFSNNGVFKFQDKNAPIDLNDYGVFKLYANRPSGSTALTVLFTFFLDSVQQTLPYQISLASAVGWQTFVVPIPLIRIIGTTKVNQLRVNIQGTPSDFYLDWIQLQKGINIINSGGFQGVQSVKVDSIPYVANSIVQTPTSTPHVQWTSPLNPPATVYGNELGVPGIYHPTKVDLTSMVTNQLAFSNIATICDGCYLGGSGGNNGAFPFITDTTFVVPPLFRDTNLVNRNDTLTLPISVSATPADSALELNRSTGFLEMRAVATGSTPTLQQVFNTEVGGSVLTKNDSIEVGTKYLMITTPSTSTMVPVLQVTAPGNSFIGSDFTTAYFSVGNHIGFSTAAAITGEAFSGTAPIGIIGKSGNSTTGIGGLFEGGSTGNNAIGALGLSGGKWNSFQLNFAATISPAGGFFNSIVNRNDTVEAGLVVSSSFDAGSLPPPVPAGFGTSIDMRSLDPQQLNNELMSRLVSTFMYNTGSSDTASTRFSVYLKSPDHTMSPVFNINAGGALAYTVNVVSGTANTLVQISAFQQVFSGSSTSTWVLPPVAGNTGLSFLIKNRGSANIVLNSIAGGNDIYTTTAVNTTTIAAGASIRVVCDGTYYLVE